MAKDPDEETLNAARELLAGGFHPAPDVEAEPAVVMSPWAVVEVMPSGERHLCGWIGYEGRVSSAITAFDPRTRMATTRSGRQYRLVGPPGYNRDALYVWDRWSWANRIESQREVSAEYVAEEPRDS